VDQDQSGDLDAEFQPRRRLTQAEAKAQTRGRLLAAGAQVFARKGFAGASLEEIAELAGYTTGALYHHFANKEKLFLELLETGGSRQIANWIDAVSEVFEEETSDPFDALSRSVVERSEPDRTLEPLAGEFWLYAVRNPAAMAIFAEKLREQHDRFEPIIAAAMRRDGTPPGITPGEMTTVALVLLPALARFRRIDPDSVPDDLLARVLRRLFGVEPSPVNRRQQL
jgi:AcrR family transcriptional regulator